MADTQNGQAHGLSVPKMLGDPQVYSVIQRGATGRLKKELDGQVEKLLVKIE